MKEPSLVQGSFARASSWKRLLTVLAGPISNFLFSFIIFSVYFFIYGRFILMPVIGGIVPNMPAQAVGLQIGDRFLRIDDQTIESFGDVVNYISLSDGRPLKCIIKRGDKILQFYVKPRRYRHKDSWGNILYSSMIGITSPQNVKAKSNNFYVKTYNLVGACKESFLQMETIIVTSFRVLNHFLHGRGEPSQLSGPTKIVHVAWAISAGGFMLLLNFIALLSINIGFVNLFPIMPLDGGHVLLYSIETIIGRPVPFFIQSIIFKIGIFFVVFLTVFSILNDFISY